MASFSLTEKLVVTGAFLAAVALVVGTEDDPGLVATGQETVKGLRPVAQTPPPLVQTAPQSEVSAPQPSLVEAPLPDTPPTAEPPRQSEVDEISPELDPVPLD